MFDIGFSELTLIAILGLIILGPERLPGAAKTLGTWVRKIRGMAKNFNSEIERELDIDSLRKELANQNEKIMQQAQALSKKLNRPVEEIQSLDDENKIADPNSLEENSSFEENNTAKEKDSKSVKKDKDNHD